MSESTDDSPPSHRLADALPIKGAEVASRRLLTIPNLLCSIRFVGAFVLIGLALRADTKSFLGLFVFLSMTDWIDGKLAIWLDQRSVFGARLDTVADISLYAALFFGGVWLKGPQLWEDRAWIAAAVISYAMSVTVSLIKFGRWPAYHTRGAKTSWLLILIGAVMLLAGWSRWPLRVAMVSVVLTNLEAIWITIVLPCWRADVLTVYHAYRLRAKLAGQNGSEPT